MNILSKIQTELNAPKNQRNNFGNYNYRSCEDILEGLKPLLDKYNSSVTLSDDIVMVGDRIYVKATARIFINVDGKVYDESSTAFAREPLQQKGMNEAQITGSASSYARKYALNGLFAIDDNKDADTDEHQKQNNRTESNPKNNGNNMSINQKIDFILEKWIMPENDRVKYKSDIASGKQKKDQAFLNKLEGLYK